MTKTTQTTMAENAMNQDKKVQLRLPKDVYQ